MRLTSVWLLFSFVLSSVIAQASIPAMPIVAFDPAEPSYLSEGAVNSGTTQWKALNRRSMLMLSLQHSARLGQRKTTEQLGGPFVKDYFDSLKGISGWKDGDNTFTNYVAHPIQGAVSGFAFVHANSVAACQEFGASGSYWKGRLKALAFSAFYSTQFELGPFSEASVGNVGKKRGTMGFVDLVMTPVGGLGWMIGEDAIDQFVIKRLERKLRRRWQVRAVRVFLNPTRSIANVLRFKLPWRRDGRQIVRRGNGEGLDFVAGPCEPNSTVLGMELPTDSADEGGELPSWPPADFVRR